MTPPQEPDLEVRADAYPEFADYRDTGCDLHDACLTCPFEQCRYDIPAHKAKSVIEHEIRTPKAKKLLEEGLSPREIAQKLGVSTRTVYRLLGGRG